MYLNIYQVRVNQWSVYIVVERIVTVMKTVSANPKRNPIVRELRTPKYKQRIVKSRKKYDRKNDKLNLDKGDGNAS